MELHKITLPTAYMLETLRSKGISNEEILTQVVKKDVSSWESLSSHFDFSELIAQYEQDPLAFESIVHFGYQVKFVTIRGIENLLKLTFDKVQDRDFVPTEKGITGLHLSEDQLYTLKQMLSTNWIVQKMENGSIQIELP
ncbi:hypothetical protein ACLM5H_00035 [Fredinandcohnia humi]